MKDFYVQLMSNASTVEFPANSANSFKNRLPNPLQFREPGWKVGLASVTYPTPPIRPHQTPNFQPNDLICRFQWSMKSLDSRGNVIVNNWTFIITGKDIMQPKYPITGGKSLMKYIVNRYETRLREIVSDRGDTLLTTDGKKFYPVFRWEGDDLIIDNSNTFLNQSGERKRPKLLFGTKLVEAMNWIEKDSGGYYYTRGNGMVWYGILYLNQGTR